MGESHQPHGAQRKTDLPRAVWPRGFVGRRWRQPTAPGREAWRKVVSTTPGRGGGRCRCVDVSGDAEGTDPHQEERQWPSPAGSGGSSPRAGITGSGAELRRSKWWMAAAQLSHATGTSNAARTSTPATSRAAVGRPRRPDRAWITAAGTITPPAAGGYTAAMCQPRPTVQSTAGHAVIDDRPGHADDQQPPQQDPGAGMVAEYRPGQHRHPPEQPHGRQRPEPIRCVLNTPCSSAGHDEHPGDDHGATSKSNPPANCADSACHAETVSTITTAGQRPSYNPCKPFTRRTDMPQRVKLSWSSCARICRRPGITVCDPRSGGARRCVRSCRDW